MSKRKTKAAAKAGLPPGSLVHVGPEREEPVRITIIRYDPTDLTETTDADVSECKELRPTTGVTWVNVDGIHDLGVIETISGHFNLHPLAVEDIVHTTQRPKAEDYDHTLFVVAKMLTWDEEQSCVNSEQVSFVLGANCLLTFQEKPGDVFDVIRQRLRANKGRIRQMGAAYLLYALLDAIVDYYFIVLEAIGEHVESLQEAGLGSSDPQVPRQINYLRRQMLTLRRAVWPLREVAAMLAREKTKLLGEDVGIYFRDLNDHTVQIIETAETFRDTISGVMDLHLSELSNRTNEVMKVLTIIATIFIPLTFIAGIYGMNFDSAKSPWNMPELRWYWGYPAALIAMIVVAAVMVAYFRRKRWL